MSGFLTPLQLQQVSEDDDERTKWVLTGDLVYQSDLLGKTITVPSGFSTDLASVPRAPVAYWVAGGVGNRAAAVHDYLVREKVVDRALADSTFKEALLATGVDSWRAELMYVAVSGVTESLDPKEPSPYIS
jgi:hypothetical protein